MDCESLETRKTGKWSWVLGFFGGLRRRRGLFVATALAFVAGALVSTGSQAITREQSPYAAVGQLARVLVLVENYYVEPVDREKALQGAIKGMVAELDPHSSYLPPEDFKLFQSETEGSFGGIGVEVDARSDAITVIAPIEGAPADRAGIRSGDRIIAVDGRPIQGQPLERIVRLMRGVPGSQVRLMIRRPGVENPHELTIVREQIHLNSVASRRLDGDIAYLRIKQFQQGSHEEFMRAIAQVRQKETRPLAGVVLDLRSNPGGLVDEATSIADELLDRGTIYTTRHRGQITEEVSARSGGALSSLPIVALVNEYSASASELVAGALQDHKRAVIVGSQTFGKGSVQSILELPGGAGMKLTTMLYYTPSGRSIQARGVTPDVAVNGSITTTSAIPVFRERDMEGHISQESAAVQDGGVEAGAQSSSDAGIGADAATGVSTTALEPSRDVRSDPTTGKDLVLSIGYQLVRGVLNSASKR